MLAALGLCLLSTFPCTPQDPPAGKKPHVAWQRTLADALAVQQATGLPLLVVVNMDGETFNERFAGTTYHDPAFLESTRGYVCVVASPDRHTDKDYDAQGNRVECPRFGGCTCSEHINIEPELFKRWFNNQRNAPRHVGVSTAGKVLFDRFLDQSMQTAIDAIAQNRGTPKPDALAPTNDLVQLFTRRDSTARETLENLFRRGDTAQKRKLLEATAKATNEPFDLLRIALRSDDDATFTLACAALAKVGGPDGLIDVEDALARLTDKQVAKDLVAKLGAIGGSNQAAARLAEHFAAENKPGFAAPWGNRWKAAAVDAKSRTAIEAMLDTCEKQLAANAADDETRLRFGIGQLMLAMLLAAQGDKNAGLWFEDARTSAQKVKAEALLPEARALLATAAWLGGDAGAANSAMNQALLGVTTREPDAFLAGAFLDVVLSITAQTAYARAQVDQHAVLRKEIERTVQVLDLQTERGSGGEAGALAAIGLIEYAGLRQQARQRLHALVLRHPASQSVHERWRNRLFVDLGPEAVRKAYAQFVDGASDKATAQWYAGYAALIVGEQHTRDSRWAEARTAYGDAIERLAASAKGNEAFADSANHFAVLALAGRAAVGTETGELEPAVADLLRAAELRRDSLDADDGLKRKPRGIASRLARALEAKGQQALADQLKPLLP